MRSPATDAVSFVRWVLDKYPKARHNDQWLLLATWYEQGLRLDKGQIRFILDSAMKAETVRRSRQDVYQRGYYPKEVEPELFAREDGHDRKAEAFDYEG